MTTRAEIQLEQDARLGAEIQFQALEEGDVKAKLELCNRVLARYNMYSSHMKMRLDIERLKHLMSLYRG